MARRKPIDDDRMLAAAAAFASQAAVAACEMFDAIDGVNRDGTRWAASFSGEDEPDPVAMVKACKRQLGASSGQALYAAARGDAEAFLKESLAVRSAYQVFAACADMALRLIESERDDRELDATRARAKPARRKR